MLRTFQSARGEFVVWLGEEESAPELPTRPTIHQTVPRREMAATFDHYILVTRDLFLIEWTEDEPPETGSTVETEQGPKTVVRVIESCSESATPRWAESFLFVRLSRVAV